MNYEIIANTNIFYRYKINIIYYYYHYFPTFIKLTCVLRKKIIVGFCISKIKEKLKKKTIVNLKPHTFFYCSLFLYICFKQE